MMKLKEIKVRKNMKAIKFNKSNFKTKIVRVLKKKLLMNEFKTSKKLSNNMRLRLKRQNNMGERCKM